MGILRSSIRSDNLNEDCIYKYIHFYTVLHRSEIKLPSSPQAQLLQSKLKSNQCQGRGKMTALQLGKRVIDHDGPCHYRDRAALSNSAHILFEQSSERDEEHIERRCTIHLILYSNALISLCLLSNQCHSCQTILLCSIQ